MEYTQTSKQLLDELLSPIPFMVRPMAKKMIEKQIFAEAEKAGHTVADDEDVIRGYIIAGAKKEADRDRMKKFLTDKGYDLGKYEDLFTVEA
ncbi:DUF2621 family protein [Tumebacillus flagellatus]|uniref:Light-independent protochlorophyllide reductase subunit B-like C-terminal domain-containing protein n=1 Tax=Tumebacillus flagellatus TaxID=1157490 RepID=A0A074LIW7_9BACL|nr:DUF2621 family protein [Tumebacillus flagellatus]KEO81069.1 hypothetical protein EL26_22795 [Tumebacillus flagellatus]